MSDESTQFVLGDAAAAASEEIDGRRRFFRRRKKNRPTPPSHCENCSAPLTGEYCAQCGQHAIDYRRSLLRVLIDAADSFFNWDTKFLKSVGVLLVRPWRLTNDFNAGKRVRYVHPLRLYLLASIAFFLTLRLLQLAPAGPFKLSAEDRAELNKALGELTAPDSPLSPEQRAKVEAARARLAQPDAPITGAEHDSIQETLKLAPNQPPTTPSEAETTSSPTPRAKRTGGIIEFDDSTHEDNAFGAWMERRIKAKVGEDGTRAQLFLDTLRGNIPAMMLCCIPLFAFVLKVLYFRQRRFYIEHLIYALHIHTFAYLGVVVITLIGLAVARWNETARAVIVGLLSLVLFVQVLRSIRRVYGQGWFFTVVKFYFGGVAYFMILLLGVGATAFVTLLLP